MLRRMRQGLMLEVAQGHGNEIKGVEIQDNECDVYDMVKGIGQAKHTLHVVAGQEIQGIALDLKDVDLQKGVGEDQGKNGKLAARLIAVLALVAEVGLTQGDHADRADQQQIHLEWQRSSYAHHLFQIISHIWS